VSGAPLHPHTPLALAGAVTALAVLLPAPAGPVALLGVVAAVVAIAGPRGAFRDAAPVVGPIWFFLLLLHGLLGDGEPLRALGVTWRADGLRTALGQGARLGAIILASAAVLRGFRPAAFLDAAAARGRPLGPALLVVATLEAIPRLRRRAAAILAAQRARGLRVTGSPVRKLRALVPLGLPLLLGAIAEADDRAVTYASRGMDGATRRTALEPPADRPADRVLRALALAAVLAALAWRLLGRSAA
jgi:energy-coupling factor transporter transmembrane protein EcfT